jgi:hypothetical protein
MLLVLQQNMLLGEEADLVPVPDVLGQSEASATAELAGEGFAVAVDHAKSNSVAAGLVMSQNPAGGTEALSGSTVYITISLGPETGAGSNKKRRRRYVVEIDGQSFEVRSQSEAIELLQRARAIAERQAEQRAEVAEQNVARIARRTGVVPQLKVKTPEIVASPELDVGPLIEDIQRLYKKAGEIAELRLLLMKQLNDEDEELLLL